MTGQPTKEDLQVMEDIGVILSELTLEKKLISSDTSREIILPIQNKDWKTKTSYSKKLQQILTAAQTEQEILEKSKELQRSMNL